jgi:hypothetical protein
MKNFYQMNMGGVFKSAAQSVTWLYRQLAISFRGARKVFSARRMAFCDTADWQSALRVLAITFGAASMLVGSNALAQNRGGGFGGGGPGVVPGNLTLLDKPTIAARPEEIKFPPLDYQPPVPEQYRVQLKSGPVAYVVPDRELPLVSIVIYVHTGEYLEPAGKEGLASMTGYLLARGGAGTNSADQLEERLAFLAAGLGSDINGTQGSVSLNLLSKDLDEGLSILGSVLFAPKFQDDKIALRKQQILHARAERNEDECSIAAGVAGFLGYGSNLWDNRYSTMSSF